MNTTEMIEKISKKDFDLDGFVQLSIADKNAREEIVSQMLKHPAIMVYYHCYYVVEKASQQHPDLFYPYWGEIAELLQHENSYHRDFALEIIGNLTRIDREGRFAEIADDYFALVNDEKFMTGNCCVRNLLKIYRHQPQQRERVIDTLLEIDQLCDYSEKQKGVLKADVLAIFDAVYAEAARRDEICAFMIKEAKSISPKTRKKAKELIGKYGLQEEV